MIYIHIPYCKQKCSYCNFHFSTSLQTKDDLLLALQKEITLRKDELTEKKLSSLYFGGGTPSVLSSMELEKIIDTISKYYHFENDIEITIEVNPDDLSPSFIKYLSSSVFNRLSIGVQSFFDEDLKMMNRAHNAQQADTAIKRVQDVGLENISIDLMYGSPTSNEMIWKENLQKTIDLQVPHISSYALTVEPNTALNQWIKAKKIQKPDENRQNEDFYWMTQFLKSKGFEHYEISNFAKPNSYSKHNSAYWQGKPYLGLGPSAHSFDGDKKRSWNVANNTKYIKNLMSGILPSETENLSEYDRYNETIMLGLRTKWGVDLEKMKTNFSEFILEKFNQNTHSKIKNNHLIIEDGYLKIPENNWFMADGIASDLFLVE